MRTLGLTLIAVVLVSLVPARGVETTAYLAPREGAAANGAGLEEAPSDVEPLVGWRRGVLGTEATDRGERAAGDSGRQQDRLNRGGVLPREEP